MKIRNVVLLVLAALLVGTIVASCASAPEGTMKVNPDAKFPLVVDDKNPAFLFPVNLSHAGFATDPLALGIAVSAGISDKLGKTVVSGQQLFDLVGNLSFELAEDIDAAANSGNWTLTGSAADVAKATSDVMGKILEALAKLNVIPDGYKFKYIIAVHTHGAGGAIPMTIDLNTWGGMYEVATGNILDYMDTKKGGFIDDPQGAAALAQMPDYYVGIIKQLIAGKLGK